MTISTAHAHPDARRPARLKFAAPLRNERMSASSDHVDYLGLENIESWTGRIIEAESKVDDATDGDAGLVNVFREGDVLFGKLRPYLAKACHAPRDGVCSTELLVMRPVESLHPRFLLYSLLTPDFVGAVDASTFGAKMPRASWDFIGSLEIRLPPIDAQSSIANYLDRETTRIGGLIAEKERMLALLEEKRAALISRVVTRGLDPDVPLKPSGQEWLGEIPAHWDVPPVYARFEVQLGKMLDEKKIKGTHLASYLRNVDVQWGAINTADLPEMDFDDEGRQRYALRGGDILVCEGGEIGRSAIWGGELEECYYQKALHRLRPLHVADDAQFFVFLMFALVRIGVFNAQSIAATIQHLPAEKLRNVRFPAPPLSEQRQIVAFLNQEVARIQNISKEIASSVSFLRERRAALITAAVTGQIPLEEMRP